MTAAYGRTPHCKETFGTRECGRPASFIVGLPGFAYFACHRCAHFWAADCRQRLDVAETEGGRSPAGRSSRWPS
jgi:hypothetical protein